MLLLLQLADLALALEVTPLQKTLLAVDLEADSVVVLATPQKKLQQPVDLVGSVAPLQ